MTTDSIYSNNFDLTGLSNEQFKMVVSKYMSNIEQGEIESEYLLGVLYLIAKPTQQSNTDALKWLESAALKGHVIAQTELCKIHARHPNFERNYPEAYKWCRMAAEQGCAEAQNNLGTMYRQGVGVTANNDEAIKWLSLAAENGVATAKMNLGLLYGHPGEYHSIDLMLQHLIEASEAGSNDAAGFLANAYFNGFNGQSDVDYDSAHYWATVGAQDNNVNALIILFNLYRYGKGVEQDSKKAIGFLKTATEQEGSPFFEHACHILATAYDEGEIVSKDHIKAFELYSKAAPAVVESQFSLAVSYKTGIGTEINHDLAFMHFTHARNNGFAPAAHALGRYYEEGEVVVLDYAKAAAYYHEALAGDHLEAAYDLISMYRLGQGVTRSLTTAYALVEILINHSNDATEKMQLTRVADHLANEMSLVEYDNLPKVEQRMYRQTAFGSSNQIH